MLKHAAQLLPPGFKETQVLIQRLASPFSYVATPIGGGPTFVLSHRRRGLARRIVAAISLAVTHMFPSLVNLAVPRDNTSPPASRKVETP
jgi:hypothetical protein